MDGLSALHARLVRFRSSSYDEGEERHERRVLNFVRGLRFSAQLIYVIRRLLSSKTLAAHWGHLVRDEDVLCSPECDIILHRDGKRHRWNGDDNEPVMDFWFIEPEAVRAVISCKSRIRKPSDVDRKFCQSLRHYGVKHVGLFAECCSPSHVGTIAKRAKKAGYDRFFHLYTLDPKTGSHSPSERSWDAFVRAIRGLEKSD